MTATRSRRRRRGRLAALWLLSLPTLLPAVATAAAPALRFAVSYPAAAAEGPLTGRILLLLSKDDEDEPRFEVDAGVDAIQVFGLDVESLPPGREAVVDASAYGYPYESLARLPAGRYRVQAVLHRYETFHRADGHTVELPADRGEGQHWYEAPGNLYSEPVWMDLDPSEAAPIPVHLDHVMPPIEPPADTEYVKHVRIKSARLSEFWGRDVYLGATVLLPWGFADHPGAHYPVMIYHGHFQRDFAGFRTEPPDPHLQCVYDDYFHVPCYNRIVQQEAYDFYRRWTSPGFPRFLVVQIQHANPYYDDSYAVNSANLGPYGDAITYELLPEIEKRFRGIGAPWARFLYGGSTGGWEALADQVFYPEQYNGAFAACPDPVDFRAYTTIDVYDDDNAYFEEGPFDRVARPGLRDWRGEVSATIADYNHMELALGAKDRSGEQFDAWEAVFSPVGEDGYPRPLWNKETGAIDHDVAAYWREHYDLRYILARDWGKIGPDLVGKIHIYVGTMDSYYLNDAVYLMEDFLEDTKEPYYAGQVEYGDRAEHCWNGDPMHGNYISRLHYNTSYLPQILKRIEATAPKGADLTSWRY